MKNAIFTASEFTNAAYYLSFRPIEPSVNGLPAITVDAQQVYTPHLALASLWSLVTRTPGMRNDFIVYAHGSLSEKEKGLSLVVDRNVGRKPLTPDVIQHLNAYTDASDKQRSSVLGIPPADLQVIDDCIADIQVASIRHLAFRACNIGQDEEYLLSVARLFNAQYVSAPVQRDFFTKADFYRISVADMETLIATGSKLKTYEEKAAQIAAAKGRAKAQIVESGLTVHGTVNDRVAIYIRKQTHSQFNLLAFATSAKAVENFYAARFRCQTPVRFTEDDFFGDVSSSIQSPFMVGRTMGLFGLSRGASDIIKFPNDPDYTHLIRVVKNDKYIGDVPMYVAPMPSQSDLINPGVIQRVRARLQRAGRR